MKYQFSFRHKYNWVTNKIEFLKIILNLTNLIKIKILKRAKNKKVSQNNENIHLPQIYENNSNMSVVEILHSCYTVRIIIL